MKDSDNLFVITGGPGSGKTTLIESLGFYGFGQSAEAGRQIIRDQVLIGGTALPSADRATFAELMLSWDMRAHRDVLGEVRVTFFDRGVPDVLGYLQLERLPVPLHVARAAREFRYNRQVFIAPPWREIYAADEERRQTFDVAEQTFEAMRAAYANLGYDLVTLPKCPVDQRCEFVMERVAGR